MTPKAFQQFGQGNLYLLLPAGVHNGQTDGTITVIDGDVVERVVAAFTPGSNDLLIDLDHGSLDQKGSSEAAGWITSLVGDERGVWAKVLWTDTGAAAILGGRYRYLSAYCATQENDGMCFPVEIESATLCNNPGLEMA